MTKAADKKKFRAIGHHLKPIVTVAGNGLSESVMSEISRAITDHELIKIKVLAEDRSERKALILAINEANQTEIIQTIGNMALLYKAAEKPNRHFQTSSDQVYSDLLPKYFSRCTLRYRFRTQYHHWAL